MKKINMSTYDGKLKDPRWQKRRLEIFQRDGWRCGRCDNSEQTLHVHHRWYEGEPWEAPDEALVTLCEDCHSEETESRKATEKRLLDVVRRRFFYAELEQVIALLEQIPEDLPWEWYNEQELTDMADAFGAIGSYSEYAQLVRKFMHRCSVAIAAGAAA
jgi:hypothetical protein